MTGLYTTYSDRNKIIIRPRLEWIEKEYVFGNWPLTRYLDDGAYSAYNKMAKHTQHITESYQYYGMTKEAAQTCAAAMLAKYNYSVKVSEWQDKLDCWYLVDGGINQGATVKCEHVGGTSAEISGESEDKDVWQVTVDVNVIEEVYTKVGGSPTFVTKQF